MAQDTSEVERRRDRSPGYPGINLETALARARTFYDEERQNAASVQTVLKHWGYKPRSGAGLVALAALKKFGLMEDEGSGPNRQARLSPLALRILRDPRPESSEREEAIREAALMPPIHRELWLQAQESGMPSADSLEWNLRQRGFTDNGAREFVREFLSTMAFARLGDGDSLSNDGGDKKGEGMTGETDLKPPPSPAGTQTVRAPLAADRAVVVQMPKTMTPKEWAIFEANLAAWKLGTVEDEAQPE